MNRNPTSSFFVTMIAFLSLATTAFSADKWETYYSMASKNFIDGKYDEAFPSAKQALVEAERQYSTNSINLSKPLRLLANIQTT